MKSYEFKNKDVQKVFKRLNACTIINMLMVVFPNMDSLNGMISNNFFNTCYIVSLSVSLCGTICTFWLGYRQELIKAKDWLFCICLLIMPIVLALKLWIPTDLYPSFIMGIMTLWMIFFPWYLMSSKDQCDNYELRNVFLIECIFALIILATAMR